MRSASQIEETVGPSARPAKIRRTLAEYEQHPTHWYPDGDVMFQCGRTRFKVHRSRLTDHCGWFKIFFEYYPDRNPVAYEKFRYDDHDYLDTMLGSHRTVDGSSLFDIDRGCLGPNIKIPTVALFSALLNFVYNWAQYAFRHPNIDDVVLLAEAAVMYDAQSLIAFVKESLKVVFPRELSNLKNEPSVYVAIQGILLAGLSPEFDIRPAALHDLARSHVNSLQDFLPATTNPQHGPNATSAAAKSQYLKANCVDLCPALTSATKSLAIQELESEDLLRAELLQKHLNGAWDDIFKDLLAKFSTPSDHLCGIVRGAHLQPVIAACMTTKSKHSSDPIIGIRVLLKEDLLKTYCARCNDDLARTWKTRRATIWKKVSEEWAR